eukprot:TRINITY_DN5806_c0_g1_i6.p1 TRINITY_DN5806_c0_g1~~TRINITY_DN5806_c0_g1_i6.p1  ORF type:complete len:571 (-),score=87.60 TRINITY_DN5806_c0_g1_i6:86-1798(-)
MPNNRGSVGIRLIHHPISKSHIGFVANLQARRLCEEISQNSVLFIRQIYRSNFSRHIISPLVQNILNTLDVITSQHFEAYSMKKRFKLDLENWTMQIEQEDIFDIELEEIKTEKKITFSISSIRQALVHRIERWKHIASLLLTTIGSLHYSNTSSTLHWLFACTASYISEVIGILKDIRTCNYLENLKCDIKPSEGLRRWKEVKKRVHLPSSLESSRGALLETIQEAENPNEETNRVLSAHKHEALELSTVLIDRASSSEATELVGPLMIAFANMTPMEVWNKLYSHYWTISHRDGDKVEKGSQRNRLLNLIIKWIRSEGTKLGVEMLDRDVTEKIHYFCDVTLIQDGLQTSANKIKQALYSEDKTMEEWESLGNIASIPIYNLTIKSPETMFQVYTPHQMASQMTLVDHNIFGRIQKWELLKCRWAKEKTEIYSRNVLELVRRIDMISHSVATTLLIQERTHTRIKIMKYFIHVADILCNEMHNFSSGLAVLNAFSMACVARLGLEAQLPSHSNTKLKSLTLLQNPEGKFQTLRTAMMKSGEVFWALSRWLKSAIKNNQPLKRIWRSMS